MDYNQPKIIKISVCQTIFTDLSIPCWTPLNAPSMTVLFWAAVDQVHVNLNFNIFSYLLLQVLQFLLVFIFGSHFTFILLSSFTSHNKKMSNQCVINVWGHYCSGWSVVVIVNIYCYCFVECKFKYKRSQDTRKTHVLKS